MKTILGEITCPNCGTPICATQEEDDLDEPRDIVAKFIFQNCDFSGSAHVEGLYQSFRDWCECGGEKPVSRRVFGQRLTERGFEKIPDRKKGRWIWSGISLESG